MNRSEKNKKWKDAKQREDEKVIENVRVDLHVHVDGKLNKENVIKCLQKAEADGVKKLCLLEHSHLDVLDPIVEILKEGSLSKYYSGELIIGCEYDTIIDAHHKNSDGTNYDGFVSHILCYCSLEDALALKQNEILHSRDAVSDYEKDYAKLLTRISALSLPFELEMPTFEALYAMNTPHIVKDLQAWIVSNPNRREQYKLALKATDRTIDYPSDFIRNLSQDPKGPLFYKPESVPYSSELFKIVRSEAKSAKFVLAHPAYMQAKFNTEMYLETMMSYEKKLGVKTFDGIEVCYYLNTPEEQKFLNDYADKRGFIKTAGSDSIKVDGEMYFIRGGEKYFFVPELGNALGTSYDMGKVQITQQGDKKLIKAADGGSPLVADKNLFEDIKVDEVAAYKLLNCDAVNAKTSKKTQAFSN